MIEHLLLINSLLLIVGFIAAFVDTVAGGGGLITLPALLFSGLSPVFALGTNKFQTVIGELSSTMYFLRNKTLNYRVLIPCFIFIIIGSTIGAIFLQFIPIKQLEKLIPILLTYVLIQMLLSFRVKKQQNESNTIQPDNIKFTKLGLGVGFYNGFFGPGTGSLWTVMLMKSFKINCNYSAKFFYQINI